MEFWTKINLQIKLYKIGLIKLINQKLFSCFVFKNLGLLLYYS